MPSFYPMPEHVPDSDLQQARSGDREALERLIVRTAERIGGLIEGRLGPNLRKKIRPSDIFQSAYLQVVRDIGEFEGQDEDAFVRWVGRVIENNIRMKARFFGAEKRRSDREADASTSDWISAARTPSSEISKIEDLLLVGRAFEQIREDYREVILMRTVDGLSHEDIAEKTGRSAGAARMLLSRARAALCLEVEKLEKSGPAKD